MTWVRFSDPTEVEILVPSSFWFACWEFVSNDGNGWQAQGIPSFLKIEGCTSNNCSSSGNNTFWHNGLLWSSIDVSWDQRYNLFGL